jgi:hypothetical protein
MKKIAIALFLVLIGTFEVFTQEGVPFVAYWSIGDSFSYNITKSRKQVSQGVTKIDETTKYSAQITVVDSTADTYVLKGIFENQILAGTRIPEEVLKRVEKYATQEVIWVTTELGEFKYIDNWEEISTKVEELNNELVIYNEENNNTSISDLLQTSEAFLALYASKEGIEQLVFSELLLMHFPFGYEFETGKPIVYEEEFPNLLGGPPLSGEAKISVKELDLEESRCTLIQESKINPSDAKKFVQEVLKKSGVKDKEMSEAMSKAKLDIRTTIKYDYFYDPGIPLNIVSTRISEIKILGTEAVRTDSTLIERIE